MQKIITSILLLCLSTALIAKEIDIAKSKGIDQEVISSLSPSPTDNRVKRKANIKVTFNEKLKQSSVNKHNITLKYLGCQQEKKEGLKTKRDKSIQKCKQKYKNNKHLKKECIHCAKEVFKHQKKRLCKKKNIKGDVKYLKNKNTIVFNPHNRLNPGYYQVKIKGLKTQANQKIKHIMYRFEVSKNSIESITLSQSEINLKVSQSIKLTLQANYKDGTTQDITKDINWIVGNSSIISVDIDGNLKALKAGETLIQAEYYGVVSQEVKVSVLEVINGYVLPPEPDPAINNSTLLGIDVNDNGVRDDVERYIIKRYAQDPDFPKTKTAIAMQYAWSAQKILESPTIDSKKYSDDAIDCQYYWMATKTQNMAGFEALQYDLKHEVFNNPEIKDKIYNTRERIEQKFYYNSALSGNIFSGREESLQNCQINIDELGE